MHLCSRQNESIGNSRKGKICKVERLVGTFNEHSGEGGSENRAPELDSGGLIPPLTLKNPSFRKQWVFKFWEADQFKVIGNHSPQLLILKGPSLTMGTKYTPVTVLNSSDYNNFFSSASCVSFPRDIIIHFQWTSENSKNVNSSTAKETIHWATQSSPLHS